MDCTTGSTMASKEAEFLLVSLKIFEISNLAFGISFQMPITSFG